MKLVKHMRNHFVAYLALFFALGGALQAARVRGVHRRPALRRRSSFAADGTAGLSNGF